MTQWTCDAAQDGKRCGQPARRDTIVGYWVYRCEEHRVFVVREGQAVLNGTTYGLREVSVAWNDECLFDDEGDFDPDGVVLWRAVALPEETQQ